MIDTNQEKSIASEIGAGLDTLFDTIDPDINADAATPPGAATASDGDQATIEEGVTNGEAVETAPETAAVTTPTGVTPTGVEVADPLIRTLKINGKEKKFDLRDPEQAKKFDNAASRHFGGMDAFVQANKRYKQTQQLVNKLSTELVEARRAVGSAPAAPANTAMSDARDQLANAQAEADEIDDPILRAHVQKSLKPLEDKINAIGQYLVGNVQQQERAAAQQRERETIAKIAAVEPAIRHPHVQTEIKAFAKEHGLPLARAARLLFQQKPILRKYADLIEGAPAGAGASRSAPTGAAPVTAPVPINGAAPRKRAAIPQMTIPGGAPAGLGVQKRVAKSVHDKDMLDELWNEAHAG